MGITGLIPFLNKSSRRANIKEYASQTVAIDAYCWLHKGAFSCADKLVMNEPTVMYVSYCMKFINMLLSHDIKPILVFDGRHLPAKAETERKRRENRVLNRKKGGELLRAGQVEEGRNYLRRSIDITHDMALNLIKECRRRNIDCIVAPYEADAQLAYLNVKNIAQVVVTEDSDLLLFGCVRVLFKMDINGNGILIERDKLHVSMGIRHDSFDINKFRYMCILSGCDYLPSLPGIGLNKARKFINRVSEPNMYNALLKLPVNLHMWTLQVTDEYRNRFIEADKTFRYQLVYDPIQRKQVPLNETENETEVIGEKLDDDVAFQLAIGNLDPFTLKYVDHFDPDLRNVLLDRSAKSLVTSHDSIWNPKYTPRVIKKHNSVFPVHGCTKGISLTTSVSLPLKRPRESDSESNSHLTKEFLLKTYGRDKRQCHMEDSEIETTYNTPSNLEKSPILFSKKNPFALQSQSIISTKKKCRFETALASDTLVKSRYFSDEDCSSNGGSTPFHKKNNITCEEPFDEKTVDQKIGLGNLSNSNLNSHEESLCETKKISTDSDRNIKTSDDSEGSIITMPKNTFHKDENLYVSEELSMVNEFSMCSTQETNESILTSVICDKTPCKNIEETEASDETLHSPYFTKTAENSNRLQLFSSKLPHRFNTSSLNSSKSSTKKKQSAEFSQKKQQSLLTRFGFQPRPKMGFEKT